MTFPVPAISMVPPPITPSVRVDDRVMSELMVNRNMPAVRKLTPPVVAPRLASEDTDTTPPKTFVPPEYELLPVRVSVPVPTLVSVPPVAS